VASFAPEVLARIDGAREVEIEAVRRDGSPHRVIVWIVVDGEDVFVRSEYGERGFWYRLLRRRPEGTLDVAGEAIAVTAIPAADEESVARCSEALSRKYRRSRASLAAMLRPEIVASTLRLEPR
jgi:hypothetical protein